MTGKVDRIGQVLNFCSAYVALSRATRMETLQVLNFDPSKYVRLALFSVRPADTSRYVFASQFQFKGPSTSASPRVDVAVHAENACASPSSPK